MPSSYSRLLFHCVFTTQDRRAVIHENVARQLYPYMASILDRRKGKALKVGGTKDHVHLLLELGTDTPVAEAMRLIKANSSKWLNQKRLCDASFRWQSGFAAFSVSFSAKDKLATYIARQHQHHSHGGFDEELAELFKKHKIAYDPRYL